MGMMTKSKGEKKGEKDGGSVWNDERRKGRVTPSFSLALLFFIFLFCFYF